MKAQIRHAKLGEGKWWSPTLVCDFDSKARLLFEKNNGTLTDQKSHKVYIPECESGQSLYRLSPNLDFIVDRGSPNWRFNGFEVKIEWPTTHRQIFRCGDFVFYVKPEDDSLSFDLDENNDVENLMKSIIAFYLIIDFPL